MDSFRLNGLIIINKPKGYTSHDIVNVVRKKLNIKKVGHTGTLDPNATGVLPILIGTGTKISKYLVEHEKTYLATLILGKKTQTGDLEGEIIEEDKKFVSPNKENIENVLKSFIGKQTQIPPMYSAIKVNGKKLYEYARKGQKVDIKPREIEINKITLEKYNGKDEITFKVECSKGTYIRTLCEDIAKKLGTVGCMEELIRLKVNKFDIKDSLNLEDLESTNMENKIISIEELFINNDKIDLNNKKLELFLNGVQLSYNLTDGLYKIYNNKEFIGLGIIKNNLLKRDVVI